MNGADGNRRGGCITAHSTRKLVWLVVRYCSVLVHCPSRLRAAVTKLFVELARSDGMFTVCTHEHGHIIDAFDYVISQTSILVHSGSLLFVLINPRGIEPLSAASI